MTTDISILDFSQELICSYDDENYSVRDNGAILKHPHGGKQPRPTDNIWTLGRLNNKTGYLEIASVRVHRIVATAFHGAPPTKEHVVDHIDTNKQNNRPENLRWVTRLENVVLNPITAKRIALVCGSVEAFLSDPSKFRDKFQEPNYKWMCNVSPLEAQISLNRLLDWAKSDKLPAGGTLDKWIIDRPVYAKKEDLINYGPILMSSITPNAVQRNWRVPSEFPLCPEVETKEPINEYARNLVVGSIFCRNNVYSSLVLNSAISVDGQSLIVLTNSARGKEDIKPWALAEITYENGMFVHISLGNFFSQEGAEKQFCLAQGLEWTGGDSIDDYC